MVSLTERSSYSCELCELWWVLPREVHIHVNSVSYGESYREKSIFMWTVWAMVSLTEWSPYSCELCELWWILPREVHIHVNSASYSESYREKSIFMWNLRVMVNLTVTKSIFHGTLEAMVILTVTKSIFHETLEDTFSHCSLVLWLDMLYSYLKMESHQTSQQQSTLQWRFILLK